MTGKTEPWSTDEGPSGPATALAAPTARSAPNVQKNSKDILWLNVHAVNAFSDVCLLSRDRAHIFHVSKAILVAHCPMIKTILAQVILEWFTSDFPLQLVSDSSPSTFKRTTSRSRPSCQSSTWRPS